MGEGLLTGEAGPAEEAELFADAGLVRERRSLRMGGVALGDIAQAVGTPTFVYHADAIRARYRTLTGTLLKGLDGARLHYAVKANGNLGVLGVLRDLGAGVDLVSVGELKRALAAGFDPAHAVFSGVGKSRRELDEALALKVGQINVESLEELELLGAIAAARGPVKVGLRINPDVTTGTHPYISTGEGGIKFGVPVDQAEQAIRLVQSAPGLRLSAIAMHIGSQITDTGPFLAALGKLDAVVSLFSALGHRLEAVDLGGGFAIRYGAEPGIDMEQFAAAVRARLEDFARRGLKVMFEPGRFLVGSAGVLLAETLYVKRSGGRTFVIVDAGMNDLLRPSLYGAYHHIVEVEAAGRPALPVSVVGPVCETGDFFAHDRTLPGLRAGERVALLCAGAYAFSMSSNYNSRPRAAEVLVDGGQFTVTRDRETMDDLLRHERLAPAARP